MPARLYIGNMIQHISQLCCHFIVKIYGYTNAVTNQAYTHLLEEFLHILKATTTTIVNNQIPFCILSVSGWLDAFWTPH